MPSIGYFIEKLVVAVTANVEAALNLGISPDHIFQLWDWVGGRYSLWSAIGLPVALALGNDTFDQLLAGAAAMDEHFHHAPQAENAPLQLALAGVVNRSVLGFDSLVIAPYDSRLFHVVPWVQQLEPEENHFRLRIIWLLSIVTQPLQSGTRSNG
ncbi:hypothetical protein [Lactiplantibacillus plantarum]|uniref:hypothetical protein n=1 Tax=Lactiplantibacillus plantarum TaxID=1590 RepID=UPI0040453573